MTYYSFFGYVKEELKKAGIEDFESDTMLLFSHYLKADRSFLLLNGKEEIKDDDGIKDLEKALELRKTRIPLQHILGYQNFMGLDFIVNGDVLVPRFDTECLVEEALKEGFDKMKVLDMCTGSGCIIISFMNYMNDIEGYACDISEKALLVAKKNAEKHNKTIHFIESDLFEKVEDRDFDMILSNPPYIKDEVIKTLMPEVKDHDPYIALSGGESGLDFYERIISSAPLYLKKEGILMVEIGFDQGEDVSKLFTGNGFTEVDVIKDMSGNDRVVKGVLNV